MRGLVGAVDGSVLLKAERREVIAAAQDLGTQVAEDLLASGMEIVGATRHLRTQQVNAMRVLLTRLKATTMPWPRNSTGGAGLGLPFDGL